MYSFVFSDHNSILSYRYPFGTSCLSTHAYPYGSQGNFSSTNIALTFKEHSIALIKYYHLLCRRHRAHGRKFYINDLFHYSPPCIFNRKKRRKNIFTGIGRTIKRRKKPKAIVQVSALSVARAKNQLMKMFERCPFVIRRQFSIRKHLPATRRFRPIR